LWDPDEPLALAASVAAVQPDRIRVRHRRLLHPAHELDVVGVPVGINRVASFCGTGF
jgi:hypothetical protein